MHILRNGQRERERLIERWRAHANNNIFEDTHVMGAKNMNVARHSPPTSRVTNCIPLRALMTSTNTCSTTAAARQAAKQNEGR